MTISPDSRSLLIRNACIIDGTGWGDCVRQDGEAGPTNTFTTPAALVLITHSVASHADSAVR